MRTSSLRRRQGWLASLALAASTLLAACGGGGSAPPTEQGQGTLRAALTDAPACGYDHVFVTVEKLRVHRVSDAPEDGEGWSEIVLSPAKRLDLLTLTNGVLEELGTTALPAGRYQQLRLVLAENSASDPLANAVQPTGSALVALRTPSAQQSGLKLNTNIEVAAGQTADIVLDFDACRSIVKAGNSGNYNLKPVLAVLPRLAASIEGYVTSTIALPATAVSAQQNGVTVRATVPDPATGRFLLSPVPEGTYTVVVTAEGRATTVVRGVPATVAIGKTVLNTATTSFAPPASDMRTVTGTVTAVTSTASGTVSAPLTDAMVDASQALAGGTVIELARMPVDAETATYLFRLPAAAPVTGTYVSGAASPVVAAEAGAAGKYTIRASAPGRTPQAAAVDISAASATASFTFGP